MKKYEIGYGKDKVEFTADEKNVLCELHPNKVSAGLTGAAEVRRALAQPIGSKRLRDIVRPGEKTVIVTSDITRPMPSALVLPEVLAELEAAGACAQDITIVFALGSHRHHTEDERRRLAGDAVYSKYKCIDSDSEDCVNIGRTSLGTPVDIFRPVAEADRRICLGNIEYHYFAGYSGGAKAIMPGVSTYDAIQSNHSRMVEDAARAGSLSGNPVREDIEEAARLIGVDFILNVVLDEDKRIVKAAAGDVTLAHREGCRFLDSFYKIKIPSRADIVVTSPGGFPKDLNLYQAQKALDNAKHAVKDGGIIIFIASCSEGYGSPVFERWIKEARSPDDLIKRVGEHFELGGHKAAAIAMVEKRADIFLVSDMPDELARGIFMRPFKTPQEAVDAAYGIKGPGAEMIIMAHGGSTLPVAD
jgi:nickel-dependent lactate racemase